jgi:hypothetical protein
MTSTRPQLWSRLLEAVGKTGGERRRSMSTRWRMCLAPGVTRLARHAEDLCTYSSSATCAPPPSGPRTHLTYGVVVYNMTTDKWR